MRTNTRQQPSLVYNTARLLAWKAKRGIGCVTVMPAFAVTVKKATLGKCSMCITCTALPGSRVVRGASSSNMNRYDSARVLAACALGESAIPKPCNPRTINGQNGVTISPKRPVAILLTPHTRSKRCTTRTHTYTLDSSVPNKKQGMQTLRGLSHPTQTHGHTYMRTFYTQHTQHTSRTASSRPGSLATFSAAQGALPATAHSALRQDSAARG